MTLLMWLSLICFCQIMLLCLENMTTLKTSIKRELAFALSGTVILLAIALVIRYNGVQIEYLAYYFGVGLLFAIVLSFNHKNVIKGLVCGGLCTLFAFGTDGVTIIFFRLIGYEELPAAYQTVHFAFLASQSIVTLTLKRILKKRIDMNIFNNKSMYLVTAISAVMIIVTYVNYRGEFVEASGDIMYVLFFVSVIAMFTIAVRYAFKENTMRTQALLADAYKVS